MQVLITESDPQFSCLECRKYVALYVGSFGELNIDVLKLLKDVISGGKCFINNH